MTGSDFDFIRKLLKQRSGLMLSAEKQYLVESRLIPVARRNGIADLSELTRRLRCGADQALTAEVVEAMTTNETFFFRDHIPFDHFQTFILPTRNRVSHATASGSKFSPPICPARCWKRRRPASTASSRCSADCRSISW